MFTTKRLPSLPPPDARTPIKLCASAQLRWFAVAIQAAGAMALLALIWLGNFSAQASVFATVLVLGLIMANFLYTGFLKPRNAGEIIAFGIHAAARPDIFDTLGNSAEAFNAAPGTVATIAKKEPLEIFLQTRAGQIEHGQLIATQFVAPFFTCVRFRIFAETPKKGYFRAYFKRSRQLLLLSDNIDAEEFRQCRVLLRWT
jgi:hypothetical protein